MTPTSQAMRVPVEGLTVVGEAAHDVAPEMIELGFEIHTVGVSAAMAVQENVAKTKHIGQALALIAVVETDIKTGATEVMPVLQLPNPPLALGPNPLLLQSAFGPSGSSLATIPSTSVFENSNLFAFRVVSSLKIAIRDANRAGEVIDVAIRAGAVPSGSIRFLLQDEAAIERTLLEEAVRRAREKATVLAAAVGKTTGAPISISEEVTAHQPQLLYGNGRQNPFLPPTAPGTMRPPFINGQLTFSAKVSVVYPLQ
jgi:uncharacterized protein YggE